MTLYRWMTWVSIAVLVFGSVGVFMWFLSDVLSYFVEEGEDDPASEGGDEEGGPPPDLGALS